MILPTTSLLLHTHDKNLHMLSISVLHGFSEEDPLQVWQHPSPTRPASSTLNLPSPYHLRFRQTRYGRPGRGTQESMQMLWWNHVSWADCCAGGDDRYKWLKDIPAMIIPISNAIHLEYAATNVRSHWYHVIHAGHTWLRTYTLHTQRRRITLPQSSKKTLWKLPRPRMQGFQSPYCLVSASFYQFTTQACQRDR